MRLALFLTVSLSASCAHVSQPAEVAEQLTAVGAFLTNPSPYVVATFDGCEFEGPVSDDFRAKEEGSIIARCGNSTLRWHAVPATALVISGRAKLRAGDPQEVYAASYRAADATPLGGYGDFTWTLAGCEGVAGREDYVLASTLTPLAAGRCVLAVRDGAGLSANLEVTIE